MTFVRQCKCNPAAVDLDTGRCMTCGLQACPSTRDRVAALELLRKMRAVERAEELHRITVRAMDETIRTQLDCQDLYKQERLAHDARRRCAETEEAYWMAKLAPASFTGRDALALARATFQTRVLEGNGTDAEQAFAAFIEELTSKLEATP